MTVENNYILNQMYMIENVSCFRVKICYRLSHNTAQCVLSS